MEVLEEIAAALQAGDDKRVRELTGRAIQEGWAPQQILQGGLIAGMNRVGEQFGRHELFLPDVLLAARAMTEGMEEIKPLLGEDQGMFAGKIVLGTVRGDMHDIGKNLVGIMVRGAGFEVVDLGKGVTPEAFVETAIAEGAQVIGMSALLTTTMPVMGEVVELLRRRQPSGTIKTIVGGAPVSRDYADRIGADAYAYDAASAVSVLKILLE